MATATTLRCLKCNNPYTDNGTQFCSPQHRRQYERKTKTCPTPEKKVYDSVEAAWEYIASRPDDKLYKQNLRPYTNCPCRRVHIGHGN